MHRILVAFAVLSAAIAPPARAAPVFIAQAGVLGGSVQDSQSGAAPVKANAADLQTFSVGGGLGKWAGESSAAAGVGFLRGSSHTLVNITDHQCCLGSGFKISGTHAAMTIDDVVISGAGSSVAGVLNIDLGGSLDGQANFANALGDAGADASVSISVSLPGFGVAGGARLHVGAPPANTFSLSNSGLLTGYGGGATTLHIAAAALPVNTPFAITLVLDTSTDAGYTVGGTGVSSVPILAEAFASYQHTLSFAQSGPVFSLPDGYSVNSAQGGITNNAFQGVPGIPEPAALTLLAGGLAGLRFARRRRPA